MPLRLLDLQDARTGSAYGPDAWLPAIRTLFIQSIELETLKRELWRYLRHEVEGRSFLIAGHRGAGKTALVLRGVAEVADEVLGAATGQPGKTLTVMERPLLVKLHGPALFSGELPAAKPVDPPAPPPAAAPPPAGQAAPTPALPADGADTHTAENPGNDKTRSALVQVMNSLYRALATEVARSARVHAALTTGAARRRDELLELAAQLRLELDSGPRADMLRAFWLRLGRSGPGVIWPESTPGLSPDQGCREIIAIATAAQAFQVCIGSSSYKQKRNDSADIAEQIEGKSSTDLARAVDKLLGLAGGGALAAGLALGGVKATTAAATGLAAGLIGAVTLSRTWARGRKRDESVEHEFIRDFSAATLDRDLPDVIQRVRAAGLAPVFVVDELDKLPDAKAEIARLIDRLKNLTTDYGFFCFLANRDYFEDLQRTVRNQAYPRDFTYFSNLLFLRYGSFDVLQYLLRIVRPERPADKPDVRFDPGDPLAWITFAFYARHRSRLNVIELARELALAFGQDGRMRTPGAVRSRPLYRLPAAVQIAIDFEISNPVLAERMDRDPLFGQLMTDAMYCLSNAWEQDKPRVCLTPDALREYLRVRGGGAAREADARPIEPRAGRWAAARAPAITQIATDEDIKILSEAAIRMARSLVSFDALAERSKLYWEDAGPSFLEDLAPADFLAAMKVEFSAIVDPGLAVPMRPGLVREVSENPGCFEFLRNRFGRERGEVNPPEGWWCRRQPVSASGEVATPSPQETRESCSAILAAVEGLGLSIDKLVAARALPSTISESEVRLALRAVGVAADRGGKHSRLQNQLPVVEGFVEAWSAAASTLTWMLSLARIVALLAGLQPAERLSRGLRAVVRHVDPADVEGGYGKDTSLKELLGKVIGDPDSIEPDEGIKPFTDIKTLSDWANRLTAAVDPDLVAPYKEHLDNVSITRAWSSWKLKLNTWVGGGRSPMFQPVLMKDLVDAALGSLPGRLFRSRFDYMTIAEWSELAVLAFGGPGSQFQVPAWGFDAALRMLGFDGNIIKLAVEHAKALAAQGDRDPDPVILWPPARPRRLDERSILLITAGTAGTLAAEPPRPEATPTLAVPRDRLPEARPLIEWLRGQGALDKIAVEDVGDGGPEGPDFPPAA